MQGGTDPTRGLADAIAAPSLNYACGEQPTRFGTVPWSRHRDLNDWTSHRTSFLIRHDAHASAGTNLAGGGFFFWSSFFLTSHEKKRPEDSSW
jgi:hypothetical protein